MLKNKNFFRKVLYILFFITISIQNIVSQNIADIKEDISLTTDRSVYINGDNIYFTAKYSNSSNTNNFSNILYVELYNKRGTYHKSKYRIIDNIVNGKIEIPDDLISGNYLIRAYTNFQRNFPTNWFELNMISIINPLDAFPKENITNLPNVEAIINKSNSDQKIILRVNDYTNTKKILLFDAQNTIINEFSPNKNGLLTIESNTIDDGTIKLVNNNSDTIEYSKLSSIERLPIFVKSEYIDINLKSISLYFSKSISNNTDNYKLLVKSPDFKELKSLSINTNELGEMKIQNDFISENGIYYFILKDLNGNIIFVCPQYFLTKSPKKGKIFIEKKSYTIREKAVLEIDIDHKEELYYSQLKIIKRGLGALDYTVIPRHITFDHYLLNSFLKNKVVFSKSFIDQVNACLSLNKDQYNSDDFKNELFFNAPNEILHLPDIRNISVTGTLTYKESGLPITKTDILASIVYGENQLIHNKTDKKGNFIFSLNNVYDEQNLFLTVKPKDKDFSLTINNDFHDTYYKTDIIPLIADTANIELFTQLYVNNQTKKVFSKENGHSYLENDFNKINLTGLEDIVIKLSDYIEIQTVLDVFNELVPSVKIVKVKGKLKFKVFNDVLQILYDDPLVLIDYLPVYDIEALLKINPKKIEKISVFSQQYVLGGSQFNGIVLINTKTKNFGGIDLPANSFYFKYIGESKQSIPHFPDYGINEKKNDHKADFRNILYYNTFKNNIPKKIQFYTSDSKGIFDVIYYGKSKGGDLINLYDSFIVE